MAITKDRISSPLEAGTSLLELKRLPLQLTSALDYVSSRLVRKGLHLSMVVIRKDVNILPVSPSPVLPQSPQGPYTPSVTTSPVRSLFNTASSTFTKSLSKHSSSSSISDDASSTVGSPSTFSHTRWPGLPSSPKLVHSPSPPSSPRSINPPTSPAMNSYGISLMQTTSLTPKAEKILRRIIQKAERKLSIGSGWLPSEPLSNTTTCRATTDLIRRSITQNSVLFSSEGLTLLSLDHIYDFKCHIHSYMQTLSSTDLTSTVDGLRRLVLSQNGRKVNQAYLMRVYDWLEVSQKALSEINEAYKTAYGGRTREGGIEMQEEEEKQPQQPAVPLVRTMTNEEKKQPHESAVPLVRMMASEEKKEPQQLIQSLVRTMSKEVKKQPQQSLKPLIRPIPIGARNQVQTPAPLVKTMANEARKPPTRTALASNAEKKALTLLPLLNLQTNFQNTNHSIGFAPLDTSTSSSFAVGIASPTNSSFSTPGSGLKDLEVGESAKGRDYHAWSLKEDKGPHMRGPMTPNGHDDITPMTKGEWSFLKDGWYPRTAAVETCR